MQHPDFTGKQKVFFPKNKVVRQHLDSLAEHFDEYFLKVIEDLDWIRSPFSVEMIELAGRE